MARGGRSSTPSRAIGSMALARSAARRLGDSETGARLGHWGMGGPNGFQQIGSLRGRKRVTVLWCKDVHFISAGTDGFWCGDV